MKSFLSDNWSLLEEEISNQPDTNQHKQVVLGPLLLTEGRKLTNSAPVPTDADADPAPNARQADACIDRRNGDARAVKIVMQFSLVGRALLTPALSFRHLN